jgi:hypothetical protein
MKNTEHAYIDAGYKFIRASTGRARAIAEKIRVMLESEHPADQDEARRLIRQGMNEARLSHK